MDEHPAIRIEGETVTRFMDHVIREDRFRIHLNGELFIEQIASHGHIAELGAGLVISEGLSDSVERVDVQGENIYVEADVLKDRELEYRTGGGFGLKFPPKHVYSPLIIAPAEVVAVTRAIESETWRKTGGVHCSVLYSQGEILAQICDIGRHNTVDKVIGYAELNGIDRSLCCIGCTGRQPAGMVSKDANAGIPVVISRAASTNLGILTAEETGICLICFSRNGRFTIYSNPQRILGIMEGDAGRTGEEEEI
ncbi:MAG: formate dehydrogenase accessory sulfurtransferase FdhD [Methanomicrobiaceae archaeon]|nr:formate dehydrogenase accessory sulfurtransferase FdhD [Methanomicrobiaceae archaeon]